MVHAPSLSLIDAIRLLFILYADSDNRFYCKIIFNPFTDCTALIIHALQKISHSHSADEDIESRHVGNSVSLSLTHKNY